MLTKTIRIYTCDYCGKTGEWSESWRHKTILHKRGLWDEGITVCSPACAAKFDKKKLTKPTHRCTICNAFWRLHNDGWTLVSESCGECCDNVEMGDQMESLCDKGE